MLPNPFPERTYRLRVLRQLASTITFLPTVLVAYKVAYPKMTLCFSSADMRLVTAMLNDEYVVCYANRRERGADCCFMEIGWGQCWMMDDGRWMQKFDNKMGLY
jgi:hypothetical protein